MAGVFPDSLVLEAPAKVNLCLAVQWPPQDGYHALDSVFATLDLHDTLTFSWGAPEDFAQNGVPQAQTKLGTTVRLDCGSLQLAVEKNLIFRAIDAAEQACSLAAAPQGGALSIAVEKHIPAGGGLGGGSSDAACALKAFAQVNDLDTLDERLLSVAQQLGADVAFFLYGGTALMNGRGDTLARRLPTFPLPLVLMGDDQGNSTAAVYALFDEEHPEAPDAYALTEAIEDETCPRERLAHLCQNNLGPAACQLGPRLSSRLERAQADADVLNALVTGSGSTSYAICADESKAARFAQRIASQCAWTCVARCTEA